MFRRQLMGPSVPHSGEDRVLGGVGVVPVDGVAPLDGVGVPDEACQHFRDVVNLESSQISSMHRFKKSGCPASFFCTISGILSCGLRREGLGNQNCCYTKQCMTTTLKILSESIHVQEY